MKKILIISSVLATFAIQPALAAEYEATFTPKRIEARKGNPNCIPSDNNFSVKFNPKKFKRKAKRKAKLVRIKFKNGKSKGRIKYKGRRTVVLTKAKVNGQKYRFKLVFNKRLKLKKAILRELAKKVDQNGVKHSCLFVYKKIS